MFERFSDEARLTIRGAQEQARDLKSSAIGSEHLLLRLLAEGDGTASRVLEMLALEPGAIRAAVLTATPPKRDTKDSSAGPPSPLPYTRDARKVLESRLHEAVKLGHRYLGAEHILLALIKNRDGVAGRVLAGLGADLETARGIVGGLVEEHGPPPGLPAEWSEPKRPRRQRRRPPGAP